MFYDRFAYLCSTKGVSVSRGALEAGISKSLVTKWKANKVNVPSAEVIEKLCNYFHLSVADLLGEEPKEKTPTLTQKDERDIARNLEKIMADLENSGDLMFDGDPMSDEARDSIRSALKLGLEAAKLKNKETYTPKKYRKD